MNEQIIEQPALVEQTTLVYQYGIVPTADFPRAGIESMFQANKLWNNLVALHNDSRVKLEDARCTADDEYALIRQSIDLADQEVEAAYTAKREARAEACTKDASHPLIKAANDVIKQAKDARSKLYAAAKDARKRADESVDKKALSKAFNDAVNAAQRVENTGGLGSTTANAVADYFKTARDKAFKDGARLNFHRFDGTGYLSFRFSEAGKKTDGVTFDWLKGEDNDSRAFVITGKTDHHKKPKLHLRVKVAGGKTNASKVYAYFDIVLHRPIPEGAQVQNAKILRRRVGDKFSYFVDFTIRVKAPAAQPFTRDALGVDIGFRQQEDGGIKVAAFGGTHPQDGHDDVTLPADYVESIKYVDQLKGELDDSAELLGKQIRPLLKAGNVLPEDHRLYKLVKSIANLPAFVTLSFEKAYKLAKAIRMEPEVLPADVELALSHWFVSNVRKYREMHHLRVKLLSRRKHLYRNVAAELVKARRPIGIEKINLTVFAETKDRDNKLGNTARSNRFLAAPSELLGAIKNAAKREGLQLVEVGAAYTSKTCSACGTVNNELKAESEWICGGCGVVHDRDENASVNIARRALDKLGIEPIKLAA